MSWILCAVLCVTGAGLGFLLSVIQDKIDTWIISKKMSEENSK